MCAGENKGLPVVVKLEEEGLFANVRVVTLEFQSSARLADVEDHQNMVDSEAGKRDDVHDGQPGAAESFLEMGSHAVLVAPGEGKNHPPIAPLHVALPCAPAGLAQQIRVGGAELPQVGESRDGNAL